MNLSCLNLQTYLTDLFTERMSTNLVDKLP
jgi:hypothetical protein